VISRGNNRGRVFHEPEDYLRFVRLMIKASKRTSVDLFAACLMPNHFHLVLRPSEPRDLACWIHWLLTTHAIGHHRSHKTTGRLWEGRFKAFAIQLDGHFLTVLRYVERNALRAGLVARAEDWPWGSLAWRTGRFCGPLLAPAPVAIPSGWVDYVNRPQTVEELAQMRECAARQRPFGTADWTEQAAAALGVESSLKRRGRQPRDRAD
jgi:putative transposase